MINSTLMKLSGWKSYYFMYNHRLLFLIGLAFSRSLTSYAIIKVLVWYFTYYGEELVMAAVLSNIHDSLSSILVIFVANATDSFVGRFHTLLFSNTAYIGGLMLMVMFNPYDVKWLLVITLALLTLGSSGDQLLQDVLKDLVNDCDKSQDQTKKRSIARAVTWSRIAQVSGAISTILWVSPNDAVFQSSWGSSFLICLVTMTISLVIFCTGHKIYHQGELTERPVEVFFRVLQVRIKKLLKHTSRRINDSSRLDRPADNLRTEKVEVEGITQERSPQRVDSTKRKEAGGSSSCKQEDVVIVKSLLRMFPMWGMFLVVSIISATGSTFFLQQYTNLNTNTKIAIQIYDLIRDFSSFAVPFLYDWICGLRRKNEKVKIGVGMLCGIISCIFAWQLEVHRLKKVNHLDDWDENTSISFLWLVPQFCVLGCMEGLTGEGLLKFYTSQMKEEPLQSYGKEYIEFVMGIGTLLNIFLILIVQSQLGWFGYTINDSRLDKYYLLLVFVCLANFIIYCLIARYYYKNAEQRQDLMTDDLNQGLELSASDNHEQDNQVVANDDQEQDNQVMANSGQEIDNQLTANDYQEQDNQVVGKDDQDQDNQAMANDDQVQEQDNQVMANSEQKIDNQLVANDDQEQDNQVAANDDQDQDN